MNLVDYIEDSEMRRMVSAWLLRITADDEVSEDVQDAAQAALDRLDELVALMELTSDE